MRCLALAIPVFVLFATDLRGQTEGSFEEAVARAVAVQEVAASFETAIPPVRELEKLSDDHADRWLGPYWAAYLSTQAAMLAPDAEAFKKLIESASTLLEEARKRNPDASPSDLADLYTLEATVQFFTSRLHQRQGTAEKEETHFAQSRQALQHAIRADPDNPRAYTISGLLLVREGTAVDDPILVLAGHALLEKASLKFTQDPLPTRIHPSWAQNWLRTWLTRAEGYLRQAESP